MTPELMAEILELGQRRILLQGGMAGAMHLKKLMDVGAWIDAALALLELELPRWHIRRIAYEGGEWHCALSRQRELPDWLDQSVEARHPNLALAILTVLIEARETPASPSSSVPASSSGPHGYIPFCCDNFA